MSRTGSLSGALTGLGWLLFGGGFLVMVMMEMVGVVQPDWLGYTLTIAMLVGVAFSGVGVLLGIVSLWGRRDGEVIKGVIMGVMVVAVFCAMMA